jgi:hypothetical protein
VRDPRRSANEISQAFSALLAGFDGSQYGAIHRLPVTRPARGDASRRSNAAGSEVRSAAAWHQSASLVRAITIIDAALIKIIDGSSSKRRAA